MPSLNPPKTESINSQYGYDAGECVYCPHLNTVLKAIFWVDVMKYVNVLRNGNFKMVYTRKAIFVKFFADIQFRLRFVSFV